MKRTMLILTALVMAAALGGAAAPIRPGVTVVLDASSAEELVKHAGNEVNLVHGLVRDAAAVARLNAGLLAAGKAGRITVSAWDGTRIPFVADTVNVIVVASGEWQVASGDIKWALAPFGGVVDRAGRALWEKPWPEAMDEWPHYLYAPNGNSVAKDELIGAPRRIKWLAGPKMLRHHDHLPSLNAMVSSGGRVFYIFDEASSASILFPPKWSLIARDAFNGVVLWKKQIPEWHPHLWPLKSMPATLPRRLVSIGNDVYVTLGIKAPVTQLNAVDGSRVKVFAGSERCEEIIVAGDTLLALCLRGKGPLDDMDAKRGEYGKDGRATGFPFLKNLMGSNTSPLWLNAERRLIAYDLKSGKEKWRADGKYAPLSLATDNRRVYFHNSKSLQALDFETGKKLWTSDAVRIWEAFYACYGASLVVHDDVVIFSGGENYDWQPPGTKRGADDTMTAVSAVDGKKLWSAAHPSSGYRSPEDLLIAQGLVWAPDSMKKGSSTLNGLDPRTGEVKRSVELNFQHGFHHRCYSSRATETYMLASKVGINTIAFDGSETVNDQWVRGACGYGFMPANGLIYATPDPCNCFPESKLNGFVALAKANPELEAYRKKSAALIKAERGQAAGVQASALLTKAPYSWPTYRANAARSSSTANALPGTFGQVWKQKLGGRLSAPVVASGRVYVSAIDANQIIAVGVDSGKTEWAHVAGSRVDSPPTVVGKLLYFGAADGTVTCLKADDGGTVWRRRLAPTEERIVSDGRIESVWPAHGSVTYHAGLIYAVAGRNMFVDGGLTIAALDPLTGEAKHITTHSLEGQTSGMNAVPAKTDILSASGANLFMRSLAYNGKCERVDQRTRHIFSVNGYLNDSWFHRCFWTYAPSWSGGCGGFGGTGNSNHSGRIMASDKADLYAFGRGRYGWGSTFTYQLYKAPLAMAAPTPAPAASKKKGRKKRGGGAKKSPRTWSVDIPILAHSIIKSRDKLLVTGPERLYDENETVQQLPDPAVLARIADQAKRWNTKADVLVIDTADGSVLKRVSLDFAPVWDGVAVAEQSVFVSGRDGALYRLK